MLDELADELSDDALDESLVELCILLEAYEFEPPELDEELEVLSEDELPILELALEPDDELDELDELDESQR